MDGDGLILSYGERAGVPGPFVMEAEVDDRNGFQTAIGQISDAKHPLADRWIVLSPIQAIKKWDLCHICAFKGRPDRPDELGKLIAAADVTGFARAFGEADSA